MTSDIPVCLVVCTRARSQELNRLVEGLTHQLWPTNASVLVVDNDPAQSAAAVVELWSSRFPVRLRLDFEPSPGYSTVRNRALDLVPDNEAVCFIDDDAMIPTLWLSTMVATMRTTPDRIVRSPYWYLPSLPSTPADIDRSAREVLANATPSPAGTSGLLIPPRWREVARFDPYFDLSGGEDNDLLFRLTRLGADQALAPTVAFELQRVASLPLRRQAAIACWNGRLAVAIHQRNGAATTTLRLRSLCEAIVASLLAVGSKLLRRQESFEGYAAMSAGKWSVAWAPIHPPSALGPRVDK